MTNLLHFLHMHSPELCLAFAIYASISAIIAAQMLSGMIFYTKDLRHEGVMIGDLLGFLVSLPFVLGGFFLCEIIRLGARILKFKIIKGKGDLP